MNDKHSSMLIQVRNKTLYRKFTNESILCIKLSTIRYLILHVIHIYNHFIINVLKILKMILKQAF